MSAIPSVRLLAVMTLFLLGAGPASAQSRDWTSSDGRTIRGVYLGAKEDSVTLRRADGLEVTIPLAKLSEADRKFVEEKRAATEAAPTADKSAVGHVEFKLSGGSEKWPEDRRKRIVDAMDAAVAFYNKNARFRKSVTANNNPGTPTADSNYDGWINFGGAISRRVALHELAHTLGVGTHPKWQENIKDGIWTGKNAIAQLREFDGDKAVLHADRQHFWPYGLNFDNESSKENDIRHVKMVIAMRKDMGIRD